MLRWRGFDAYVVADRSEVREQALALVPENSTVAWGGSVTLDETGIREGLRTGTYDSVHLRVTAAELGDRTLDASVDRLLNASNLHERDQALDAASHRIGQLLARA